MKNKFKTILAIVVLLIAVIIIGVIIVMLQGSNKDQTNILTVVNETQVISTHTSTGTITTTKVLLLDQYAGKSLKNTQLNMVEQYYNGNNGTLNVTKLVSNTPGFNDRLDLAVTAGRRPERPEHGSRQRFDQDHV